MKLSPVGRKAQGLLTDYPAFYQKGTTQSELSALYGSTLGYLGYYPQMVPVTDEFFKLFSDHDIHNEAYFNGQTIRSTWPDGKANGLKNVQYNLFQPENAFLILAESYFRLNDAGEAINSLNKFKSFRNAGTATGLTGDQILQEIINERRKEFFTDTDKRWLDLKRYGLRTITRNLRFFDKSPFFLTRIIL